MAGPAISGSLTRLQCCPVGEGAAAVIVAPKMRSRDLGIDRNRAVKVIASVTKTEHVYRDAKNFDAELTRETVDQAYREAGIAPSDLDLMELHDAFTIEELLYTEAMGLCAPGKAASADRGGRLRHRRTLRRECVRRTARDGPSDRSNRRRADRRNHAAVARRGWRPPTAEREDGTCSYGGCRRGLRRSHFAEGSVSDALESSPGENREAAAAATDCGSDARGVRTGSRYRSVQGWRDRIFSACECSNGRQLEAWLTQIETDLAPRGGPKPRTASRAVLSQPDHQTRANA